MTNALEVIIDRKVGEAQQIVAQSYREFVESMGELRHVQARQQCAALCARDAR